MPNIENDIVAIQTATNAKSMREPIAEALEILHREVEELPIDDEPTEGSTALVKSGGVYSLWDTVTDGQDLYYPSDETIQHEKIINEAGEYTALDDGYDGYTKVIVDPSIEAQSLNLLSKHITYPGIYYASDDDCDGYSSVKVDALDNAKLEAIINGTLISTESIPEFNDLLAIGSYAFYSRQALQHAHMSSCQTIGDYAFANCINLENAEFPSLVNLGEGTFSGCTNLENIYIGSSCLTISDYAFQNCVALESLIDASSSFAEIGYKAFYNCTNLHFSDFYVDTIGSFAFENASFISPISVTITGQCNENAFLNCRNVTYISFGLSVANFAFQNCLDLSSAIISQHMNDIPDGLFKGCFNLISINGVSFSYIPEHNGYYWVDESTYSYMQSPSYMMIGNEAFADCHKLVGPLMMTNVIVASSAFKNCSTIDQLSITNRLILQSAIFSSYDGGEAYDHQIFYKVYYLSSDSILNHGEIHSDAFANCISLSTIFLKNQVVYPNAFANCVNLQAASFSSISGRYIWYSEGLQWPHDYEYFTYGTEDIYGNYSSYIFTNEIYPDAFAGCSNLETLYFTGGSPILHSGAFRSCYRLHEIYLSMTSSRISAIDDNVFESTPFAGYSDYCSEAPVIYTTNYLASYFRDGFLNIPGWSSLISYMSLFEPEVEV